MLAGNEQLMEVRGSIASCIGASVSIEHRVIREVLLTADLKKLLFLHVLHLGLPWTEDLTASKL